MSLKESYLKLITSQHKNKPKYMATIEALLQPADDIFKLAVYLDDQFDIDIAEGKQEDIIGAIVGASRELEFDPTRGHSPTLEDFAYRALLKARIVKNLWKGDIESISKCWHELFGNGIVMQDNQDMTMDVVVIGFFEDIEKQLVKQGQIIPKPQAVGVNYYFADGGAIFAYDQETITLKGYDEGDWLSQELPASFAYDINDEEDEELIGYDKGNFT